METLSLSLGLAFMAFILGFQVFLYYHTIRAFQKTLADLVKSWNRLLKSIAAYTGQKVVSADKAEDEE